MVELLLRQDKISMANSIECRVPFVDQELISFVRNNIPPEALVYPADKYDAIQNSNKTKVALKRVAALHFGKNFAYRKKEGLHSPLSKYFYEDMFKQYIETKVLPKVKSRKLFNYRFVKDCFINHSHIQDVLWRVISFEVWMQMYVDNDGAVVRNHK